MEDELARLREALAQAKRQASDEQRRREEEQRLRKEEERRRKDEERRRKDEERLRKEEERRRKDEERRREEAERLARASQLQPLERFLESCHSLSLAIRVLTDRSLTTQGDTTNPVGRLYPKRIVEWHDFPARQEKMWEQLSDPSFSEIPMFPSPHQMAYVQSLINLVSSEQCLRYFERDTVENAVQKLFDAVSENPQLRDSLGLRGTVTFESHTNLATVEDDILSKPLEQMSIAGASDIPRARTAASRKPRCPTRGKGARADQFCIYRTEEGANIPAMAIEYKAPHKLSQDEIVTGLASEIQPERDVINKDCQGFVLASKALAAAVVTQLFSYMVHKGIQYGYVCTGQVFVFLYIPDDPATVFYHVCVPNLDVVEDDENRLHRTAVAQVFAFVLQAVRSPPPPQSWRDAADCLDTWDMEYEDVLSKIPETVRKEKKDASPYKPQKWCGFTRSPIRTRLRCKQASIESNLPHEDDDEPPPPSPTADRSTRASKKPAAAGASGGTAATSGASSGKERKGGGKGKRPAIQDRAYCTHQCLLGLALGGQMDPSCPNAPFHGTRHIGRVDFLNLLRKQLACDRGRDADCVPLYLGGAVGSLFKVRLSSHGYTVVAKGFGSASYGRLQNEENIYNQLSVIQGRHVPVCLGLIDLDLPYYCDGRVSEFFLLLSWAGQPLHKCIDRVDKAVAVSEITLAFTKLHRLGVFHRDAESRNLLYDGRSIMVVDFERAEISERQPLGPLSPNSQNQKRKRRSKQKQNKQDPFKKELQQVVAHVSGIFK